MVSKSQLLSFLLSVNCSVDAFHVATRLFAVASFGRGPEALPHPRYNYLSLLSSASSSQGSNSESDRSGKNNKAMSFLKKIGKVGGAANRDFRYAIGVDEGPSGKSAGNGLNVSGVSCICYCVLMHILLAFLKLHVCKYVFVGVEESSAWSTCFLTDSLCCLIDSLSDLEKGRSGI